MGTSASERRTISTEYRRQIKTRPVAVRSQCRRKSGLLIPALNAEDSNYLRYAASVPSTSLMKREIEDWRALPAGSKSRGEQPTALGWRLRLDGLNGGSSLGKEDGKARNVEGCFWNNLLVVNT